jgi:putative transcriptional regulator
MKNSLKVERAKKNITQAELAGKLQVSRLTVHSIETGKFNPSVLLALKMAAFFAVPVESLFFLEEDDLSFRQN